MGASQRRKGAAGERAIANALKPTFPDACRGIGQARAGDDVPDVDGVPGVWIEVKTHRTVSSTTIIKAIQQASQATDGRTPVAIVRANGEQPIVCLRLGDWVAMVANQKPANDQG